IQIVQQMEAALRTELEASLLGRARTVATYMANAVAAPESASSAPVLDSAAPPAPLYAHPLALAPRIDGFQSDWRFAHDSVEIGADARAIVLGEGLRVWIGTDDRSLFLFFDVTDEDVVYRSSPRAPQDANDVAGDRIVVLYGAPSTEPAALLLSTPAPTSSLVAEATAPLAFVPQGAGNAVVRRVQAAWQEAPAGYTVEAQLPLPPLGGGLGIAVIDVDRGASGYTVSAHSTWDAEPAAVPIVAERRELDLIVELFAEPGYRFRIVDAGGWILADSGPLVTPAAQGDNVNPSLVERFFRFLLRRDYPGYASLEAPPGRVGDPVLGTVFDEGGATAWFGRGAASSAIVAAAVPVEPAVGGARAVVLERASDSVLTVTNRAMMRLMTLTVAVSLIASAGLLGYASLLSFRIGRLARAAETALGPRGEINTRLPGTRAGDVIGDLSRSFEDLLGRLREYTDYLQSLKSKLSHELRTPLAIVSTSLDNLEHEGQQRNDETTSAYLARLRHGTARLESILQAMTAATRVEQAIAQTAKEPFDVGAVIGGCVSAYRDVYVERTFALTVPDEPVIVDGSAELIEQLLDKLIDNAVGFATPGTPIDVTVTARKRTVEIDVVNRGPTLPEAMRHQLFDSLVSLREKESDKPHLGLGLYIVTLVADFHGGHVAAENLPDGSGVVFSVELPRSA
ncbi:MAG: ATP-binding protein, partial [Gammaproteobacteria bacterium]|nr:ATP-binding protein [Gammaproteobacteria bacterium]